jgi:hypothetical protein
MAQATEVSEYGKKFVELAESYSKGPNGAAYPGENAWPRFAEALSGVVAIQDHARTAHRLTTEQGIDYTSLYLNQRLADKEPNSLPGRNRAAALEVSAELERTKVLERLASLVEERRFVRPAQGGDLGDWKLDEIPAARIVSKVMGAKIRKAGPAKDDKAIVDALRIELLLSRALGHQASPIDRLVATGVADLALGDIVRLWKDEQLTAGAARKCLEVIDRDLDIPPLTLHVAGARLQTLDAIQGVYGDDQRPRLKPLEHFIEGVREEPPEGLGLILSEFCSRDEAVRASDQFYDGLAAICTKPRVDRREDQAKLEDFLHSLDAHNPVCGFTFPSPTKMFNIDDELRAEIAGVRAVLALELYKEAHGAYPESLAAVVPEFLSEVPVDPYTGEPVIYRRDAKQRFVVYCVGADCRDDGGKILPRGSATACSAAGEGFDFVITRDWPEEK